LGAHVNLIPLNPTPGYPVVGSPREQVRRFRDHLAALGVNATIRVTRGAEIDAACGQLAAAGRRKVPVEAEADAEAQAVRLLPGARSR
jgi:23S rRNA (adenine2503-C2)-methyltransferase